MRSIFLLLSCALATYSTTAAQSNDPALSDSIQMMWQHNELDKAKQTLSPLLDDNDENPQYLALMGQTEALLGNLDDAEELLEEALEFAPENAKFHQWYGNVSCRAASSASIFSAMGYAKQCRKAYERALELDPTEPDHFIALGNFYAQAPGIAGGDKEKAKELANRLKQIDELQGWLLDLQASEFDSEQAFTDYVAQSKYLETRPEPYFLRAMSLASDENYETAITYLQQATTRKAEDEASSEAQLESYYQLARLAVVSKTHVDEGILAMDTFIKQNNNADRVEWANVRLAQLYALKGDTQRAKSIAEPIFSSTSDDDVKDEIKKIL